MKILVLLVFFFITVLVQLAIGAEIISPIVETEQPNPSQIKLLNGDLNARTTAAENRISQLEVNFLACQQHFVGLEAMYRESQQRVAELEAKTVAYEERLQNLEALIQTEEKEHSGWTRSQTKMKVASRGNTFKKQKRSVQSDSSQDDNAEIAEMPSILENVTVTQAIHTTQISNLQTQIHTLQKGMYNLEGNLAALNTTARSLNSSISLWRNVTPSLPGLRVEAGTESCDEGLDTANITVHFALPFMSPPTVYLAISSLTKRVNDDTIFPTVLASDYEKFTIHCHDNISFTEFGVAWLALGL